MTRASRDDSLPSRVSSVVRGPASLREDIADEIADHLACHAEDHGDDRAGPDEAIRAFGDPEQVARELRTVHLGDWIMFQRVMVAALVVVVIGMACSTYFSWSATHALTEQMAETTRQTNQQFAELTKHLASLTQPQASNEPPRLEIFCYTHPGEQPVAGYRLIVASVDNASKRGGLFRNTYETDSNGTIHAGPLSLGTYQLSGRVHTSAPALGEQLNQWSRVVHLRRIGTTEKVRLPVGSTLRWPVELAWSPEVTWAPDAMPEVGLCFSQIRGPETLGLFAEMWASRMQAVRLDGTSKLADLLPGTATAWLFFPNPGQDASGLPFAGLLTKLGEVRIPDDDTPIKLNLPTPIGRRIAGRLYDGSVDKPAAGVTVDVLQSGRAGSRHRNTYLRQTGKGLETLRTDAEGRFSSLAEMRRPARLRFHLKGHDGEPTILSLSTNPPDQERFDVDVSKLSTVRVAMPTKEAFRAEGFILDARYTSVKWEASNLVLETPYSLRGLDKNDLDWTEEHVHRAMMPPGRYTFEFRIGFVFDHMSKPRMCRVTRKVDLPEEGGKLIEVSLTMADFLADRNVAAIRVRGDARRDSFKSAAPSPTSTSKPGRN